MYFRIGKRLTMTQPSTKRKNTLITSVIIIVLVVSSIGAVVAYLSLSTNQTNNVTVSGRCASTGVLTMFPASLTNIEFTDIQTGIRFPFAAQSFNSVGNYSVTLMNEHTYRVTISYFHGPHPGGMTPATDYITTYTVHVPAGKTSISQDFP